MSTAIQLVNRLRRRFREEDITALGDDLSTFCLDLLNEATRDLLESFTWDFDRRSDGEMFTKTNLTGIPCIVDTNDSEIYVTYPGTAAETLTALVGKEYPVTRVIVTSDPSYPDTAFRCMSFRESLSSLFLSDQNGAIGWPGTTDATATADFVFDEYVLPDTVRAVTSVRHQEQDLQIVEVDRDVGMDAASPRPHGSLSDSPERVFVGKRGKSTYRYSYVNDLGNSASRYRDGITMKFDPTPSAKLAISYSYVYRHPDMSATQALDGVDASVEDLIVRMAEARGTMSGLGADVQTGAAMETEVLNRAAALHGNSRRDPLRRVIIGPTFGGRSIPYGFGRIPRNHGSL